MQYSSTHDVKEARVTYHEETRCVTLTIFFDTLAEESDTSNRRRHGDNAFFGDVTARQEIKFFVHDSVDPYEFIASLGVLGVSSLA